MFYWLYIIIKCICVTAWTDDLNDLLSPKFRNYTSYKINIILGLVAFKALEAFSEFSYAILQEKKRIV